MLGGYLSGPWELLEGVFAMPNEQNPARENTNEEKGKIAELSSTSKKKEKSHREGKSTHLHL